uniref:Uncharacterized protein n=1 Tax=Malassezia sympodialis mycovirus TaxID=2766745 RepID=A0A7G8JUX8_9VIRU|nr:hypothetical protein [Malassezia sympodialis mycovirus]
MYNKLFFVYISVCCGAALALKTRLVEHNTTVLTSNGSMKISRDDAQGQCTAWEDKAWPMFSFTVFDDNGCNDNPRHFTNCVHYGDDFDGSEWNCNDVSAIPNPFNSIQTSGGMMGTQAYLLVDHTCPPSEKGEGDKLATFDPGDGRCIPVKFEGGNGYTVKNVGENKIDGNTQWIDTDANNGRYKLGKRSENCKAFKWDNKPAEGTNTPSVDVPNSFTDCTGSSDDCKINVDEEQSVTVGMTVSVSVGSDFIVSVNTEVGTSYEESRSTTVGREYSIPPGSKARLVASAPADSYNGQCTQCDGDDVPCNVVVPREDPSIHLEYNG